MPEGDTIHRIALTLAPKLVGETIERVTTQGLVRDLAGQQVTSVTAHGKHLVIELANGTHLRAHLGMYGRWRQYARAEGDAMLARMSPGRVTLAITTRAAVYLWIGARTIEISDRRAPRHGLAVASLGPDVLADDFDSRHAASRAVLHGSRMICEVLLDQRVASGIGNIYKCEALFVRGIAPRRPVCELDATILEALYTTARELMIVNLGPSPRATRDRLAGDTPSDDRYFVYGRSGKPCRRCGAVIECVQIGEPPRWTWWCPRCQPTTGGSGDSR